MDLHAVATFPEGILWRSGVNVPCRDFEIGLFVPIYRIRAWIFSRLKSSVDNLPLLPWLCSQSGRLSTLILPAGDFPRSSVRKSTLDQDNQARTRLCLDL